jgi:hypothetical protein
MLPMLMGANDSCGWPYGAKGTGMPSINTVERDARRGLRPRMPKFSAMSWLPVPLFSGALTPGNTVEHVTGLGGALALEFFATDHVAGAGVFEDIDLRRIAEPVADHIGGAQLDAGA